MFSIVVIFEETTLFLGSNISVFSLLLNHNYGDVLTQLFCLVPLVYIVISVNFALFEVKLQGKYGLYKNNHTESSSLIYSACFMARLIPVISYNFLLMINVQNTSFIKSINLFNILPYSGEVYSRYLPVLLIVFCILNAFNAYNKIVKFLGIKQFAFAEILNSEKKVEGKAIIAKERVIRERKTRHEYLNSKKWLSSSHLTIEESFSIVNSNP